MKINRRHLFLLLIPLTLSAVTHLWNPTGFPDIFYDEGIYMYRAMHVLAGQGPQAGSFHDHPFFGQIFLAGTLTAIGYPGSLNLQPDAHSIEMLYTVPRIVMGLLAVVDTLLIFKISERRYSTSVALLASILFAVMPITWLLRRILLDSILLPFLLSSILFAVYAKDSKYNNLFVVVSGIMLGITIFTKETAVMLIPLVAVLVYQNTKSIKKLGMWFIPVVLISLLWPLQSVEADQFPKLIKDLLLQVHRENNSFYTIVGDFFIFDPVLLIFGAIGTAYSIIKRDFMILFWIIPYVLFLGFIGYVQYFYWIPILPAFCIAAARVIMFWTNLSKEKIRHIVSFSVITSFAIFGLAMSSLLISTNVSEQFLAAEYVVQIIHNTQTQSDLNNITIVSSPVYSWIFDYVYHIGDVLPDYRYLLFHPSYTHKVLLVADSHFKSEIPAGKQLYDIYYNTTTIKKFNGGASDYYLKPYPFTSMLVNFEGGAIEIRTSNHYDESTKLISDLNH